MPSSSPLTISPFLDDQPFHNTKQKSRSWITSLLPRRMLLPTILIGMTLIVIASTRYSSNRPTLTYWRTTQALRTKYMTGGAIDWDNVGMPLPLEATLEKRLQDWMDSPTVEPADWVAENLKHCPAHRIVPNQNRQQLDQSHLLWASLNSTMLYGLRSAMASHLRTAARQGRLSQAAWGTDRGLVFTAGNVDTYSRVLLTLKLLHRHLKSPLPSEIFSFPGEKPSAEVRKQLEELGATLRTVDTAVRDSSRTKNYHIKATAIIASRFQEVLYLDSDNMVAQSLAPLEANSTRRGATEQWGDPAGLWESKAYQRLGVMLWPDYWRTSADNPVWAIIGVGCRDEWEQEAGQMIINKKYHLDALILAEWMMDSSRFKFWFNMSDGDKDMFRYAFLALRKRWGVPGRYVAGGMFPRPTATGPCAHTMLQHDHRGRPLFVHANLLKQIPSGVGPGFSWGMTRAMRAYQNTWSYSATLPPEADLEDFDTDCDQLANAGNDGRAIKPAPPAVRRRAALENGIRAFFHGGWNSALCIDLKWEDPRTEAAINSAKRVAGAALGKSADEVDVSFTASDDGLEIKWENPLVMQEWANDPRLRDFEDVFFLEGGQLSAVGF